MRVPIKDLGSAGWAPDQTYFELAPAAMTSLQNFRTRDGWAERVHGYRQVFTSTVAQPNFMAAYTLPNTKYIIHATGAQVYADGSGTRTTITGSTAFQSGGGRPTAGVLSGIFVINDSVNPPQYWNGTGVLTALPGWNSTYSARALRPFRYHLVALNVTKNGTACPHRVMWSGAATPGSVPSTWTAAAGNEAGEADVVGDGVLVDALPMGDILVLYKERSMAAMTYVGGNDVFNIAPLPDPVGMLAPGCGAVVPGVGHVILTQGDVVAHALSGHRSILDGKAKLWLQNNLSSSYSSNSFVVADYFHSEVWICIPTNGNQYCNSAIVWNWRTDTLSQRDLPTVTHGISAVFNWSVNQFANDTIAFNAENVLTFTDTGEVFGQNDPHVLTCTTGGKIYAMDSTDQADGSNFTGYVEFGALANAIPFDASADFREGQKNLSELAMEIDAAAGTQVSVYFGASNDPTAAPTYQTPVTFTVGTDKKAFAWACGVYPAVKLSSTGWFRVRTLVPELKTGGMY